MNQIIEKLKAMECCQKAIEWLEGYKTPQVAWNDCERGDWMLWLLGRLSGPPESESRKKLVLCACQCARLALPYTNDHRVEVAIETAEAYVLGVQDVGLDDVKNAAYDAAYAAPDAFAAYDDAYSAAYAAYDDAYDDAYAAYAAADAAAAAAAAAYDDAYAAYAAAAAAAAAADAYGVKKETLKRCANIVREFYPGPPKL